jgi:hypothetical protein
MGGRVLCGNASTEVTMHEDFAGNTLGTARGLEITPHLQSFTDSLSPLNSADYYSFTVGSSSSLSLSLSGLSADAELELLDSQGKVLQSSVLPGTELESLLATLDAGQYYIKVYSGSEITTNYNLSFSATPSQDAKSLQQQDSLTGFGNPSFDTGVFTVGATGQVSLDYLFDGGAYQGELAIFSLEGMEQYYSDLNDFIGEAARRALSNSDFGHVMISDATEGAKFSGILGTSDIENYNAGTYTGLKTVSMLSGDTFGVMLVPNGTVQQVLDNPYADGALRPLFSLSTKNPNDAFHLGQIADVVGDGTTFVMEDMRVDAGSDKDYNDIIFRFTGATGYAELLKDVIAPGNDWRYSQLGQQVLSYVSDYDNPDKKEPGNPTYPGLPIANLPIPTIPSTVVDQGGNGLSDLTGTSNGVVQPNQGGALPNTPTQIQASVTGDVIDQVSSIDPTDIYKVSSSQLSNTEISVLSGNTAVSILSPEGTLLSQQVLSRGDHSLTLPQNLPADVLLKFENQPGADGTYMLKGFESKAAEPFNIDIDFGEGLTASQQQIIQAAARSIEPLITQGLPSALVDGKIIDDINFKISAKDLDGAGGTLAQTKVDFMRYGTLLPAQSITNFDAADLAQLESSGQLFSVVQHEMLHGLGFGNLWEAKGLVDYAKTSFARYTGENAVAAFKEVGGLTDYINLETEGKGSADLHWNKNLFQDELMTRDLGFQTGTDGKVFAPISPVTLAALADLGYEVNLNGATPNWGLLGGTAIRAEDLTDEQIEALQKLAEEMEAQPTSDIPIIVPAVDPSTISPEIWAHAERFDLNGEYYDWELVTIQDGDTVSQYVWDRMTDPSKLDNRPRVVRANDPAYWQFVVDRNIALGVEDPHLIFAGRQIWLPTWNENYEWEQEQERLRREAELNRQLEEERKERERLEEIYRQKGSGGLEWWLAKPFPDFGDKAPFETSVRDVVGSQVPDDYFRFTLSRPGYVTIYLEDLLADADLYLYDSRNRLIGKAERPGVTDEKIILNLEPGTYMVRVHSANGLATDYNLNVRFDGLPTRTQIGTGNSGSRNRGPIFSDPRIAQIYTTALAQFEAAERQKAQAQINTLEAEKRRLDQELRDKLAAMNAEQRAKVYAALDGVRNQGQSWVNSKANDIKGTIDRSADWVLGLIDGAIPSQIYSIPGLGGAIKSAQDNLKGAINGARSWLNDRVNDVQTAINNAISGFINGLKNAYMTGAEINSAIERLAQDLQREIDKQVINLNNSVDKFKSQVVSSLGFLRNVGVSTPEMGWGPLKIPAIKWNFYDGVVAPLADKLASSVKNTATSVSNALKGTVDFVKPLAQGAVAEIVSKFLGDETGKLYNQIHGIDQQIANIRAGVEKAISDKAAFYKKLLDDFLNGLGEAKNFIVGALMGEFNNDPSIWQVLLDSVIGMIPIVGEIGDVRDLIAYTKRFIDNPAEIQDPWNWIGVTGSLIGLVPVFGGAVKGVTKIARNADFVGELKKLGPAIVNAIVDFVKKTDWSALVKKSQDFFVKILDRVENLLRQLSEAIQNFKDLLPRLGILQPEFVGIGGSPNAGFFNDLADQISQLRREAPKKLNDAFAFLKGKLDDLVSSVDDVAKAVAQKIDNLLKEATLTNETAKVRNYQKTGGFEQANKEFDEITQGLTIKEYGQSIRSAEFPDGTTISVRPPEIGQSEKSTIQINRPNEEKAIKVRYD